MTTSTLFTHRSFNASPCALLWMAPAERPGTAGHRLLGTAGPGSSSCSRREDALPSLVWSAQVTGAKGSFLPRDENQSHMSAMPSGSALENSV